MNRITDLLWPLLLFASVALWLQLSRARERAAGAARRLCRQHGLQLLDDSVGLRGLRLRRLHGRLRWERCYAFEVSIDGDDREPSRLWMVDGGLSGFSLPTIRTRRDADDDDRDRDDPPRPTPPPRLPDASSSPRADNVVPLRPRLRDQGDRRH